MGSKLEVDADLSCSALAAQALAADALEQSLAVSRITTKKAKVVIESTLTFLGCQFTIFAEFCQEVRSHFLVCRSVALCRAGVALLLCQRILARLVV